MKYRVLKGVNIGQGRTVVPGQIVDAADIDEQLLRNLVARACVVVVPVEAAPAAASYPGSEGGEHAAEKVAAREPEPEHREPRTRRKKED